MIKVSVYEKEFVVGNYPQINNLHLIETIEKPLSKWVGYRGETHKLQINPGLFKGAFNCHPINDPHYIVIN